MPITNRFKLLDPIYRPTASYGHMGREPQVITSKLNNKNLLGSIKLHVNEILC